MKNTTKNIALVLSLTTLAATSMSVSAVDLRVIGAITPASCTPSLAGGGTIDYGSVDPKSMSETDYILLSVMSTQLSIRCNEPAKIAIKGINGRTDSMAGSVGGVSGFGKAPMSMFGGTGSVGVAGLGKDGDDNIGGFSVRVIEADNLADGTPAATLYRVGTSPWRAGGAGRGLFSSNDEREVSWAVTGTTEPVAFTTLSTTLEIQAYINKSSELDMTKPINLNGMATIELIYL